MISCKKTNQTTSTGVFLRDNAYPLKGRDGT